MIWRGTDKLPNRAGTHPEWAGKYTPIQMDMHPAPHWQAPMKEMYR